MPEQEVIRMRRLVEIGYADQVYWLLERLLEEPPIRVGHMYYPEEATPEPARDDHGSPRPRPA